MADSTSAALLQEFNEKKSRIRLFPLVVLCAVVVLGLLLAADASVWLLIALVVLAAVAAGWTYIQDDLRKSVVLFYDFEPEQESAYDAVHESLDRISSCERVWHISARGNVLDRKYHAGADALVSRSRIAVRKQSPPYVKTNVSVPAVPVGRQTLYFFPDRILVFDSGGVGAVPYNDLDVTVETTQFIEGEGVPGDARIVGQTWRYVNKQGGPDRRFKDNAQIPIAEYGAIHFRSASGLNELIQTSRSDVGNCLPRVVDRFGKNDN